MGALPQAVTFIRTHALRLVAISGAVLIPCFWHRRIEAGDLGSHVYNAWLAQLIRHGQVPGLYVARMWINVLFDYLLSGLAGAFGLRAAEKIAVSLALLIFFWGTFALVSAATRRAPWYLLPILAAFTYGWTFEMGFFNYYISLGVSFFGLAIFWRGKNGERLLGLALAPLILLAHPLGVVWLLGAATYIFLAERLAGRYHVLLFLAAAGGIFFARYYIQHHFIVEFETVYLFFSNGTDQLELFSGRYETLRIVLFIFVASALLVDVILRRRKPGLWKAYSVPLALYVLVELAVYLLPDGMRPPDRPAALALLTARLTSFSSALLCCLLGAMVQRKWHLAGLSAIAAVFFFYLYQDTGKVNRMEDRVEQLIATLPPNQRVMATILSPSNSRVLMLHIVDRACIGRCFSYGNYEPSSQAFRIRARPGNPYVISDYDLVGAIEDGSYTVLARDLPLYQIYQCSPRGTDLCIRQLEEDEDNDRLGVHPQE